ncbi:MAG: tryptophan--tRNA ligase, partial [bacterium]
KSYDNAIYLKDGPETVWEKLRPMVTDPARVRRTDPGDPEKCPVYDLHRFFTPQEPRAEVAAGCASADIGCIDCKKILFSALEEVMEPIRSRRQDLETRPDLVRQILEEGNGRAREEARFTMASVREAVRLYRL